MSIPHSFDPMGTAKTLPDILRNGLVDLWTGGETTFNGLAVQPYYSPASGSPVEGASVIDAPTDPANIKTLLMVSSGFTPVGAYAPPSIVYRANSNSCVGLYVYWPWGASKLKEIIFDTPNRFRVDGVGGSDFALAFSLDNTDRDILYNGTRYSFSFIGGSYGVTVPFGKIMCRYLRKWAMFDKLLTNAEQAAALAALQNL